MLGETGRDLGLALRSALRRPVPSGAAVLCLAVGIGANAALYGAFGYFVLRPLPVGEPERLVRVLHRPAGTSDALDRELSWPEVLRLRRDTPSLDGVAVFDRVSATLRAGDRREPVLGQIVSGDFFRVLRVPMQRGPGFEGADPALGTPGTAVLTDSTWRRRFGADPGVIGRRIQLDEHPFEIVGVAAPDFRGVSLGLDLGVFVPLASRPAFGADASWEASAERSFQVLARLAPGVSREAARAEAQAAFDATGDRGMGLRRELAVLPERAGLIVPDAPGLLDAATLVAFGGLGLVLLVACANVGGLLLARAVSRRRELAVRIAVGASRGRLARLLVAESAVLALPATVAGLLLAHWASDAWTLFLPPLTVPIDFDVTPDAGAAAYAAVLGLATALLASALPLRQALRTDVVPALHAEGGGPVAASGRRLLDGVVVAQLAFSASVLVLAGLFLATLAGVRGVDPGFDHERSLFARLDFSGARHDGAEAVRVQRTLRERAAALPAVRAAALTTSAPLSGLDRTRVRAAGAEPGEGREVLFGASSPGSFDALGVALLEGRDFREVEPEPVAIVSRALARELWPGERAVGRHVVLAEGEDPARVVGVATDYTYLALMDPERPYLHLPLSRHPSAQVWLALATTGAPEAPATDLRALLAEVDPLLQPQLLTGTQLVAADLWLPRTAALLAGAAAFTVLLLTAVGVLGATAFAVSRRTRELGIRVALGASQRHIARLVLGGVVRLVGIGGTLGLLAALGVGRAAEGLLFGVTAWDPLVYAVAAAVLGGVALAAASWPALRAARTAPAGALRTD